MNNNEFKQLKSKHLDALDDIRKGSSGEYNKAQKSLTDGLFMASTTYITIMIPFATNVLKSFKSNSWIILVSIFCFSLSLIPWMIEKILASRLYGKRTDIANTLFNYSNSEVQNINNLVTADGISARMLPGGRTTLAPVIIQITLFSLGIIFSIIAISILFLTDQTSF